MYNDHANLKNSKTGVNLLPHEIPSLPILNLLTYLLKGKLDLSKVVLVGVQHILETTASLLKVLIELGVDPRKIYLSGKIYSTCPSVALAIQKLGIQLMPDAIPQKRGEFQDALRIGIRCMWQKVEKDLACYDNKVDTIIICDDGGRCFEEMPRWIRYKYKIAGIEQTRAGLYSTTVTESLPFPLIEVASSAAKKYLESPLIISAIFESIQRHIKDFSITDRTVCGVIGNGSIGNALVEYLAVRRCIVVVYDESPYSFQGMTSYKKFYRMQTIAALIENSDIIFGCTGKDSTENINVLDLCRGKQKIFISCTSEDKEFLSLIKGIPQNIIIGGVYDPLANINFTINGCNVYIFGGGYPLNFDRLPWNVPARDIELTQCLMLGGLMQALLFAAIPIADGETPHSTKRLQLNPYLQRFIALMWTQRIENRQKYTSVLLNDFADIEWIMKNSGNGKFLENQLLNSCFMMLPPRGIPLLT